MSDRPILFSAPMVRALLAGSKTQTRRIVKFPAKWVPCLEDEADAYNHNRGYGPVGLHIEPRGRAITDATEGTYDVLTCPYGAPGDRLWVRETWRTLARYDGAAPRDVPVGEMVQHVAEEADRIRPWGCGRPSIFMPRWASRITLEVTGMRVERLNAISEADAVAEGITSSVKHVAMNTYLPRYGAPGVPCVRADEERSEGEDFHETAAAAYRTLWESINGAGSWDANPWVWCVEFRRVTP